MTMRPTFEQEWRTARSYENRGDLAGAREIYQSLIAQDPHRLYVRLRLSAIEQAFGDYRAACSHAMRAGETVAAGRWADLAPVARRLLDFGEFQAVFRLISAVDWGRRDVLANSPALTQYLWLAGHAGDALRLADHASRYVDSHLLSYARANALRYCGRLDEASAEFEKCIGLKPDYALAHWSLAYHAASEPPGLRVERIRRAQGALPPDDPEQPYLHYALFKELDDAGDTGAAWASLAAGARLKRASLGYRGDVEAGGHEALRAVFDSGLPVRRASPGGGHVPLFIVGMPRTGTTLLERILGAHPGVHAAGELNDFPHALSWEANRFLGTAPSRSLVEALAEVDPAAVGERYLARTTDIAAGHGWVLDKNPANFAYAGFIAQALPAARILCLRRAPMDACFSNLKELFTNEAYGYSYDLAELAEHYLRFERLADLWCQVMPEQFMVVDYEELVHDPLGVAARAAAFCGLAFDPSSVDITRNRSAVSTASSSQVRQPITTRAVGAWRRYAEYLRPLEERLGQARQHDATVPGGAAA